MTDRPSESFGVLLRDKLAELDADEASTGVVVLDDPIERLRLDARQAILAEQQGPMARNGHQAYVTPSAPPTGESGRRHLNILY